MQSLAVPSSPVLYLASRAKFRIAAGGSSVHIQLTLLVVAGAASLAASCHVQWLLTSVEVWYHTFTLCEFRFKQKVRSQDHCLYDQLEVTGLKGTPFVTWPLSTTGPIECVSRDHAAGVNQV